MPEATQVAHGFPAPQHTVGSRLVRRIKLDSPATTVTFDALPQYFSCLVLRLLAASSSTGANTIDVRASFNGDAGANKYGYGEINLTHIAPSSDTVSGSQTQGTFAVIGHVPSRNATIGATTPVAGIISMSMPGYSSNLFHKPMSIIGYVDANASTAIVEARGVNWRDTSPITAITLSLASGDFVPGSQFDLYGEA